MAVGPAAGRETLTPRIETGTTAVTVPPHGGTDEPRHDSGTPGEDDRWLRSVVENSSENVTIVDPDGTLRYASPAFGRMLGYAPEEVVGKMNVLDYVHPEDLPHVLEETEKALSEGGVATNRTEYRFRHKDGSWRWVESAGTYLLDDPHVKGVVVQTRDITERKRTEEALREAEERFRRSFHDAAIGMALVGTDGRFLRTNRSLCNMLGYREVELLGKTFQDITHPRRPRCGSRPSAQDAGRRDTRLPDGEALLPQGGPRGVGPPERLYGARRRR